MGAVAAAQDAPSDPTAALQELEKKWDDLNSFRAEYTATLPATQGQDQITLVESHGQLEMLKEKGTMKYRLDQKVEVLNAAGAAESTSRTVTLFDGERTYVMTDASGSKSVMVLSPENVASRIPLDARALLARLGELGDVRLAADEDINGLSTYVFEGSPLLPNGPPETQEGAKMRVNVDKATGIPVQWVMVDAHGATVAHGGYSSIELNPELDPKQFVFEVPVGATVIDMTNAAPTEPAQP